MVWDTHQYSSGMVDLRIYYIHMFKLWIQFWNWYDNETDVRWGKLLPATTNSAKFGKKGNEIIKALNFTGLFKFQHTGTKSA